MTVVCQLMYGYKMALHHSKEIKWHATAAVEYVHLNKPSKKTIHYLAFLHVLVIWHNIYFLSYCFAFD